MVVILAAQQLWTVSSSYICSHFANENKTATIRKRSKSTLKWHHKALKHHNHYSPSGCENIYERKRQIITRRYDAEQIMFRKYCLLPQKQIYRLFNLSLYRSYYLYTGKPCLKAKMRLGFFQQILWLYCFSNLTIIHQSTLFSHLLELCHLQRPIFSNWNTENSQRLSSCFQVRVKTIPPTMDPGANFCSLPVSQSGGPKSAGHRWHISIFKGL